MKVAKVCGCLHYDKFSGTDYMVPVYENRKFHEIIFIPSSKNASDKGIIHYNPSFAEISSILLIGFTAFSAISASTLISGDSSFRQL